MQSQLGIFTTADAANRVKSYTFAVAVQTSYTYDGDNPKRTEEALNGDKTTIIWDGTDYLGDMT